MIHTNKLKKGFTLVELVVTISIMTFVLLAASILVVLCMHNYTLNRAMTESQYNARQSLLTIVKEMRAGTDTYSENATVNLEAPGTFIPGVQITKANTLNQLIGRAKNAVLTDVIPNSDVLVVYRACLDGNHREISHLVNPNGTFLMGTFSYSGAGGTTQTATAVNAATPLYVTDTSSSDYGKLLNGDGDEFRAPNTYATVYYLKAPDATGGTTYAEQTYASVASWIESYDVGNGVPYQQLTYTITQPFSRPLYIDHTDADNFGFKLTDKNGNIDTHTDFDPASADQFAKITLTGADGRNSTSGPSADMKISTTISLKRY